MYEKYIPLITKIALNPARNSQHEKCEEIRIHCGKNRFKVSWNKDKRDEIILAFEEDYYFNVENS